VHEVEPPGVQVAPRRHARQAADVVAIERDRLPGEAVEVLGSDRAAVRTDRKPVEGIEQDENGFHVFPSASRSRLGQAPCCPAAFEEMIDEQTDSV
jgi:hypothetical protein